MIDKACHYYHVVPELYNFSQLEKGINLVLNKSNTGKKLIKDSLLKLEKLTMSVVLKRLNLLLSIDLLQIRIK